MRCKENCVGLWQLLENGPAHPNPNNKVVQQDETPISPTYCISLMEFNEIQLWLIRILNPIISPIIIENEEENPSGEESLTQGSFEKQYVLTIDLYTNVGTIDNTHEVVKVGATTNIIVINNDTSNVIVTNEVISVVRSVKTTINEASLHPPYPKRLTEVKITPQSEFDFLKEL